MLQPRLAAIALLALATTGWAGVICDTLGETARWDVAVGRRLMTRARRDAAGLLGVEIDGGVCTTRATLQVTDIAEAKGAGLVATRRSGVGVRFLAPRSATSPVVVSGDIVTGGALVQGTVDELGGTIDTSGDHPRLAACNDALAGMASASAAFAALSLTRDLGDLVIHPEGPAATVDARGGGVFRLDHLTLQDTPMVRGADGVLTCPATGGAQLTILANPGDQVVLNVHRLWIGACSRLDAPAGAVVLNLPGVGRAVRIAPEAALPRVAILAPDRDVELGGGWVARGTNLGPFWARRALVSGASVIHASSLGCE